MLNVKKILKLGLTLFVIFCLFFPLFGSGLSIRSKIVSNNQITQSNHDIVYYGLQREINHGPYHDFSARYEGPQPIGDCDNDGKNELLVGGRDSVLRVIEWNENKQTYEQTHFLICPALTFTNPSGFAIGDLTGDDKNEIAVSWWNFVSVFKWDGHRYRTLGTPWQISSRLGYEGGAMDCYIGDCDNDGKNELIVSNGAYSLDIPEILVLKWDGEDFYEFAAWNDQGKKGVYMAGLGDIDYDGKNEIVCGSGRKVVILEWNESSKKFDSIILEHVRDYPFACICKDSDMDGKPELHLGFSTPRIEIFKWNGTNYRKIFEKEWPGEGGLIEGLDVGDTDYDGINEVCAGTNYIHILQWNGSTYVEEYVIPTFGTLAVVAIGDIDNDGKNEINAGSVIADHGQDYMTWIFKYGYTVPEDMEEKIEPHWRSFYRNKMDRSKIWERYWAKEVEITWKWSVGPGDKALLYVNDKLVSIKTGVGEETITVEGSVVQARMLTDRFGKRIAFDRYGIYGCAIDSIIFRATKTK
jgi:hypothetical protein